MNQPDSPPPTSPPSTPSKAASIKEDEDFTAKPSTPDEDAPSPIDESEHDWPPGSPPGPAEFVVPTSADLAFITSLPKPQITFVPEAVASGIDELGARLSDDYDYSSRAEQPIPETKPQDDTTTASTSTATATAEATTGAAGATTEASSEVTSEPTAEATAALPASANAMSDRFGAVSRQWYGESLSADITRRDTWAVGSGWIRHVRVFEAGEKKGKKRSRKGSY